MPFFNYSFNLMTNILRYMQFSSFGTPSQTRGQVCNFAIQLLLGLATSVTLRSKSHRTRDCILLPHLGPGSLSVAPYDSKSYGGIILTLLYTVESNVVLTTEHKQLMQS
jgi:hypothetical protein